jgi:membrane-bound serine protease (ClpP class)
MAEGTNVGTAHPVDFQGKTSSEKITNDAVAYIKNLARLKNRNEIWAGEAITKNLSSSEITALKDKVVDFTAKDADELMKKADKFKVAIGGKVVVLNTGNYQFKNIEMTQKHKFLHQLSDPNIVYVLFLIGIYGLIYELANAGTVVFPGIAGVIALTFAFIGFDSLPINSAGIILIVLSAALFFIELVNPTHGFLGLGGIICMVLGSILLFPSRGLGEEWAVSYVLVAVMVLITIVFFVLIVAAVVKAFKKKAITGVQTLVGLKGVVSADITQTAGIVNIGGEDWQATAEEPVSAREIVEVLEVNGMKLKVKKIPRK